MQVHNYLLIDQKICQLANAIETNILSYTNPQNLEEQKKLFFEYLQKNEKYNPLTKCQEQVIGYYSTLES